MHAAKVDWIVFRTILYVQRSFEKPYSVVVSFSCRTAQERLVVVRLSGGLVRVWTYKDAYIPPTQMARAIRSLLADLERGPPVGCCATLLLSIVLVLFWCSGLKSDGWRCIGVACFVRAIVWDEELVMCGRESEIAVKDFIDLYYEHCGDVVREINAG